MKQTVKTSRVAGQLEKMFRLLNAHFFDGELPEVVISLKKTVGAYGHFTCGKVWQAGDERRYEINISSPTLNRPIEETCATISDSKQWLRRTGWKWSTTPNTVGQLPAPELTCWISSSNRAGRTCRWSRVFPCWMCSERSPRAGAEPKSPVAPANTFAPNVAIAAEQRRQST